MRSLSSAQARRIALAAQGFGLPHPPFPVTARQVNRVLARIGLLQMDSVNILVRSHYLPLFSRLGPYPTALLDRLAYARPRALFEYWGHEASLLPTALHPLLRWRMEDARANRGIYGGLARFGAAQRPFIDRVLAEVAARGPLGAGELSEAGRGAGGWWGWSAGKQALEWLFWAGLVTTAGRRHFERLYDLPERVLPPAVLAAPAPAKAEAQRQLLAHAARALGVAAAADLRDYYRLPAADVPPRLAELVEAGDLLPVAVEGWKPAAYLHRDARLPRRLDARALLAPFDPLIWERARTERLFGFRFRLEFYTPAAKRLHGYYVMPLLLRDRLVARVDLKLHRPTRCLHALAVHLEEGADRGEVGEVLEGELRRLAGWLGAGEVVTGERRNLS